MFASVVGSVRAFHACPPIDAEFPVFRIVESYRRVATERGVSVPDEYDAAHEVATRIEAAFTLLPCPSSRATTTC